MGPLSLLLPGVSPATMAAVLAAVGSVGVLLLIWRALVDYDPLPERLRALDQRRAELRGADAVRARRARRMGRDADTAWTRLKKRLRQSRGDGMAALQLKLARAGLRSRDAIGGYRFARLVLPVILAAGAGAALWLVPSWRMGAATPAVIVGAALVGLVLPDLWLNHLATNRAEAIRRSLPDGFDLLVICAEAGLSLDAALDRVAREIGQGAPELADEIALTALELSFLPDRHKALSGLADRVDIAGMRALTNTFMQTERYGTPLAQALRVLAHELREERMLKAEEKAARLPALLTVPMVVFILPPLFVVLIGPAILRAVDTFAKLGGK